MSIRKEDFEVFDIQSTNHGGAYKKLTGSRMYNDEMYQEALLKAKNGDLSIVGSSALLSKARQMRLEQQLKIDSYTEHYNDYEIGTLNGIDRIVKLIERHYR